MLARKGFQFVEGFCFLFLTLPKRPSIKRSRPTCASTLRPGTGIFLVGLPVFAYPFLVQLPQTAYNMDVGACVYV